ncbi:CHAT domain-containing protein [Streptomyces avermitilis]|uniref:CHAT domain-containing protein n=1 Tax=Streptomyces avermitilis TaxID=33903 RepID=UPI0033DCA0FB
MEKISEAVELMAECAHLTPAHDVRGWAERRWYMMLIHVLGYGATKNVDDLRRADEWRRELAPSLIGPFRHSWECDVRAAVFLADAQLAAVRGDAATCAEFVGRARQIFGGSVPPTGERAVETWGVLVRRRARFLTSAYEDTDDEQVLAEALALASCGIDAFGACPGTPATLFKLRGCLWAARYGFHRRRDDALLARDDFDAHLRLAELSYTMARAETQWLLGRLFVLMSDHGQLDAADAARRHTLAVASLAAYAPGSAEHSLCLVVMADIWREAAAEGSTETLHQSVGLYEQALVVLRDTNIVWEVHGRLSIVLGALYKARGNFEHLDAAIGHADRALTLCHPRAVPLNGPLLHSTLGELLRVRYERFARHEDYDRALHHTRQGVELSRYPGAAPQWAVRVSNHARVVSLGGGAENFQRAEDLLHEALGHDNLAPWERTHLHLSLGATMREAAEATQDRKRLGTAILHLRRAEASAAEGQDLPLIRRNLALALHAQWQLEHRPASLDKAHDQIKAALADTPAGSPLRALLLSDLGTLLIARAHQRLDATETESPEPSGQEAAEHAREDLERALDVLEKARDEPGAGPSEWGLFATQYGEALSFLGRLTNDPQLMEESLKAPREAVRSLDEMGPHWVLPALFLADALIGKGQASNKDRHEAAELYERVARHPMAAPATRWRTAVARARILTEAADWAGALDAYSTAIAGLPQMAWGGLDFDDQLNALSNTSQTVSDAAAVALAAGAPERALELLEHGRGLLLSYALDMRTDLEAIRRRAPELAADLDLSRDERTSGRVRGSDDAGVRRRQSQRRWDRLVEQARRQPDLAHFLEPLPCQELLDTSRHGPVVVLNSSSLRADALILHDGQLKVAPLSRFRHDKAVLRAEALARSVHRAGNGEAEGEELLERRPYLTDVLDWLWTAVAEPVLRVLPPDPARDADTAPPRIWWCPTGVFNRLPVHAATRLPDPCDPDDKGVDSLADRFVASHTPTIRALRAAREEADQASSRTTSPALLVGVGETPPHTDHPPLKHVALEIDHLEKLLPAARSLPNKQASREAVVRQLQAGAGWLHFAGHGEQDIANPDGVLYLWDHAISGSLRIRDIAGLHLEQADLAYLSACETHRTPTAHSDEPVSLAGALQLAGYRHVVASLWQLNSLRAAQVSRTFYETLLRTPDGRTRPSGPEAAARSAHALHTSVGILRARRPEAVDIWAAYVHIGP